MKAVRVTKEGSSTNLKVEDIPKPEIKPGEALIKIRASFVQPADILNSKGGFPHTTFPRTLGRDFSGTVDEGSERWKGKDIYGTSGEAFSFTEDGAHAEFAVVKENALALKPRNLSFAQAASVGTPFPTAKMTLLRARTAASDTVMVLGATGSVGSSVVQLAKAMGCKTISVGRHGTDVNSVEDPKLLKAKELTNGKGPDVVVDTVGDFALVKASFDILASHGRMSFITAPRQGSTELPVDIFSLYRRQIELVGCNSAAVSQEEVVKLMADMTPDFESGKLVVAEEKTMNLISIDQAPDAYSGKIKRAVIVFD